MSDNPTLLRENPLARDREPCARRRLAFGVIDSGVNGDREVHVEKGTIDTMDGREFAFRPEMFIHSVMDFFTGVVCPRSLFNVAGADLASLNLGFADVGTRRLADSVSKGLCDAVNWSPLAGLVDEVLCGVAESCCCQGTFGPAAVDVRDVPFDKFGGRMPIQLVADVN